MGYFSLIIFAGIGVLTAFTWWRMRGRDAQTLRDWEERETELSDVPDAFHWEDHVEDAEAWKGEDRDDDGYHVD